MLRGLYTATSAMNTNQKKLDVIANNIANANTVGFKKDLVMSESFPEVLIHKINSDMSIFGREGFTGVAVQQEDGLYNVSVDGGFFRVRTPNGISHERSLNFTVNEQGYLSTYYKDSQGNISTDTGFEVLGNRGPVYVGGGELEINERGQILVNGNITDNLVMLMPFRGIGTINDGVRIDRLDVNFGQGQLNETGNDLDFAIRGEGFFQIETPEGLRFTRDGSFKLNSRNELVTSEGYIVLGTDGPINLDAERITFSGSGEILSDGEVVNQFSMIHMDNLTDLRKTGNNLFRLEEGSAVEGLPFQGEIVQGFLENSNVDTIKEMVRMITMHRNYESNQRMIRAYDELLQKAVTEIGRI